MGRTSQAIGKKKHKYCSSLGSSILWRQGNLSSQETQTESFQVDCMALAHGYLTWEELKEREEEHVH